eukprot:11207995-Lingulodinium_polyedra.AAC.1
MGWLQPPATPRLLPGHATRRGRRALPHLPDSGDRSPGPPAMCARPRWTLLSGLRRSLPAWTVASRRG